MFVGKHQALSNFVQQRWQIPPLIAGVISTFGSNKAFRYNELTATKRPDNN